MPDLARCNGTSPGTWTFRSQWSYRNIWEQAPTRHPHHPHLTWSTDWPNACTMWRVFRCTQGTVWRMGLVKFRPDSVSTCHQRHMHARGAITVGATASSAAATTAFRAPMPTPAQAWPTTTTFSAHRSVTRTQAGRAAHPRKQAGRATHPVAAAVRWRPGGHGVERHRHLPQSLHRIQVLRPSYAGQPEQVRTTT